MYNQKRWKKRNLQYWGSNLKEVYEVKSVSQIGKEQHIRFPSAVEENVEENDHRKKLVKAKYWSDRVTGGQSDGTGQGGKVSGKWMVVGCSVAPVWV